MGLVLGKFVGLRMVVPVVRTPARYTRRIRHYTSETLKIDETHVEERYEHLEDVVQLLEQFPDVLRHKENKMKPLLAEFAGDQNPVSRLYSTGKGWPAGGGAYYFCLPTGAHTYRVKLFWVHDKRKWIIRDLVVGSRGSKWK